MFLGVFMMSFESLIIKSIKADYFTTMLLLGVFVALSSLFISLSRGVRKTLLSFQIQHKFLIIAALCMATSNFIFIYSVKFLGITISVVIYATSPIISALFETIVYKRRTNPVLYVVCTFIIAGIFIAISKDLRIANIFAVILSLFGVVCFSTIYIILSNKRLVDKRSVITMCGFFIATISIFFAKFELLVLDFWKLFFMGMFLTSISRILIGVGSSKILASEVALICVLESVFAPIWGSMFLGIFPNSRTILGSLIVIISVISYIIFAKRAKFG